MNREKMPGSEKTKEERAKKKRRWKKLLVVICSWEFAKEKLNVYTGKLLDKIAILHKFAIPLTFVAERITGKKQWNKGVAGP